ncbi:hypothetical protein NPA07_01025 [Mycoplasmopsis caviae]|uniref:DUF3137 domain-containing protein n=1 Tax=Mycoplasmopsis caviae TaxID=55603 RepID=A0A3P8LAJ3_9BACT|nr:hypothetical protein [Mycoplasmopsis caviae]UUD35442.1 hypothetical protein NPA07_01025 [Mycoplasmopsis caviae]VDR41781.1 Uncharacterised protein [Mycoplasmopsis caviae]
MKETFNQFLARNYEPLNNHLIEQDEKNESDKSSKSFIWKIILCLCLLISLTSISIVVMTTFFEDSKKIQIIKWACVSVFVASILSFGFCFTFLKRSKIAEKREWLSRVNLSKSLTYLFRLINFKLNEDQETKNIAWIDFCKKISEKGESSEVENLRKPLLNNEIGKNNIWKIQEVKFKETNEIFLLIEGKHEKMINKSYISCGLKNGIYDYLKDSEKIKFNVHNETLNFETNDNNPYDLGKVSELFKIFNLSEKKYGFIIDPKNKTSCSWIKIKKGFLNVQGSEDTVKAILNHLYLVYALCENIKQFVN